MWVCHGTPNELQLCTGVLKTLKPFVQAGRSPCCEKSVYLSVQGKRYQFFSVCHDVEKGWEALQENLLEYRVILLKNWDFSHGICLCTEIWKRYKISKIYFLHHPPYFNIIEEEPLKLHQVYKILDPEDHEVTKLKYVVPSVFRLHRYAVSHIRSKWTSSNGWSLPDTTDRFSSSVLCNLLSLCAYCIAGLKQCVIICHVTKHPYSHFFLEESLYLCSAPFPPVFWKSLSFAYLSCFSFCSLSFTCKHG